MRSVTVTGLSPEKPVSVQHIKALSMVLHDFFLINHCFLWFVRYWMLVQLFLYIHSFVLMLGQAKAQF